MKPTRSDRHLFRELDYRESDGIEVSLLWSSASNRVSIFVFDSKSNEGFQAEVPRAKALDAFHHPYAYAPRRRTELVTTH